MDNCIWFKIFTLNFTLKYPKPFTRVQLAVTKKFNFTARFSAVEKTRTFSASRILSYY